MKTFLLWTLAIVLTLAAAAYQRRTGPTYPLSGELRTAAGTHAYELPRSQETTAGARVAVPAVVPGGTLHWRRFPLDEPFQQIPLSRAGDTLFAVLPVQPAAGKLEYYLELPGAEPARIPTDNTAVLRYKGPVSAAVLVPHILLMFMGMLLAVRSALGALVGRDEPRLAWLTLASLAVGGLILGPLVQKAAFGAYWTGWPFGTDLTDDKTAGAVLSWVLACVVPLKKPRWRRALVLLAAAVTLAVYTIPHSVRGSQLDYTATAVDRNP